MDNCRAQCVIHMYPTRMSAGASLIGAEQELRALEIIRSADANVERHLGVVLPKIIPKKYARSKCDDRGTRHSQLSSFALAFRR